VNEDGREPVEPQMPGPIPGYIKIPLVYVVTALIWVVGSSLLLINLAPDQMAVALFLKGPVFILVTGLLLVVFLRREEKRQHKVERELQAILDGMSDVYYRSDKEGRFVVVTPQIEMLSGYRAEDLLGQKIASLYVDPAQRDQLLKELEANNGLVVDFEVLMRRRDGQPVWASTSSQYHYGLDGRIDGVEGMVRQIDGRKKAEVAMQEAGNLVEALLNTSPDATMLIDLKGRLLAANRVMALRFDIDLKSAGHVSVWELFPSDLAESRHRAVDEVVANGQPRLLRDIRNGRYFDNHIYPVRGVDGRIDKVAIFSRDVTEQHKTEVEILEREEIYRAMFENTTVVKLRTDPDSGQIIDANKAAAEFYGWPQDRLRGMRVMDLNLWGPDRTSHEMEQVRKGQTTSFQARHRLASGQIRDVEVHSGPIRVRGKTFLHSVVIDVTERLQAERSLTDAKLQAEASARAEMAFIARMSRELRTPLNGILGMTRLLSESPLAPEQRDWLNNVGQCNGDLMTILDELMMFSEGRLEGISPHAHETEPRPEPVDSDFPALQPMNILLAEDNYINQKVTEAILSRRGHMVTTVGDGLEAVRVMDSAHFDLILMDVQMPGRDGLWAARTLREQGHDTPIMALTAQAMPKDAELCLQAGMNGYIAKPFTAERLMGEIARLIQRLKA